MPVQPKKPCKWCGEYPARHFAYQCKENPKVRSYHITKHGKVAQTWWNVRRKWFDDNKADNYTCYLCGKWLTPAETTLDHVVPRSHDASLRYETSNLRPCCYTCNGLKGSKSLENYKKS